MNKYKALEKYTDGQLENLVKFENRTEQIVDNIIKVGIHQTKDGSHYIPNLTIMSMKDGYGINLTSKDDDTAELIREMILERKEVADLSYSEYGVELKFEPTYCPELSLEVGSAQKEKTDNKFKDDISQILPNATPQQSENWLKLIHNLSEEYLGRPVLTSRYIEETDKYCDAFKQIMERHGAEITESLYNLKPTLLSQEIIRAAEYLNSGGNINDVSQMAEEGLFESDTEPEISQRGQSF